MTDISQLGNPKGCQDALLRFVAMFVMLLVFIVAAFRYINVWAGLAAICLSVMFISWITRRAMKKAFMQLQLAPFILKGSVLKNAAVEVVSVEKVSRPNSSLDPDNSRVSAETVQPPAGMLPPGQEVFDSRETAGRKIDPIPVSTGEDATRTYWRIEVTIRPQSGVSQITRWEPAQMVLVPFASKTDMKTVRKIEGIMPARVEVLENDGWVEGARGAYEGNARVRFTFPLKISNEETRWKLRYYFEGLGDIKLG